MFSLFFLQFRHELTKLFARRRTYLGFGAFLLLECAVIFGLTRAKPQAAFRQMIERNGFGFEHYFSGLTLALMILLATVFLLGGLYLSLVAGDVVSKEVEEGTMRMLLCRPSSRWRLATLKFLACVVYTFVLVFFIGLSALAAGTLYRGVGGFFVFDPAIHLFAFYEPEPGLVRYLGALPLLALGLLSFTSLGFMFSCFNMKPAAATIATLTVMFLDFIFHGMPYFESYQPYFLTTHMTLWSKVFAAHIPWLAIGADFAYLAALDATFVAIGAVTFTQRDFKS